MQWLVAIKNFLSALSLLKSMAGLANSLIDLVNSVINKQKQKKEINEVKKSEDKLTEANQIVDDKERLRKKAEAACEIEKTLNPDSDCR